MGVSLQSLPPGLHPLLPEPQAPSRSPAFPQRIYWPFAHRSLCSRLSHFISVLPWESNFLVTVGISCPKQQLPSGTFTLCIRTHGPRLGWLLFWLPLWLKWLNTTCPTKRPVMLQSAHPTPPTQHSGTWSARHLRPGNSA